MGYKGAAPAEESFQKFTKRWVTAVNRGGLFFVKDEVYLVFFEMENKMRKHLVKLVSQRKLDKAAVIEDIMSDDDIHFFWCLISTEVDDETASQELLRMIVDLRLTIQGFSTAGAYVEYYKQCNRVT